MSGWIIKVRPQGAHAVASLISPEGEPKARARLHEPGSGAAWGRPIIYVDLDETLIHHKLSDILKMKLRQGRVRPHAAAFLERLRAIGDVIILSAGTPDYIPRALELAGLLNAVDGWSSALEQVYIRGALHDSPIRAGDRPWVLIDNQHPNDEFAEAKLEIINPGGRTPDHYIQVAEFLGADDDVLHHLVPLALSVLQRQRVD